MRSKAYRFDCIQCHRVRKNGEKFSRHGVCDNCSTVTLIVSEASDHGIRLYFEAADKSRYPISMDYLGPLLAIIEWGQVGYRNGNAS